MSEYERQKLKITTKAKAKIKDRFLPCTHCVPLEMTAYLVNWISNNHCHLERNVFCEGERSGV